MIFWMVAFLSQYPESVLAKSEVDRGMVRKGEEMVLWEQKVKARRVYWELSTVHYSHKFMLSFSKGNLATMCMGNL